MCSSSAPPERYSTSSLSYHERNVVRVFLASLAVGVVVLSALADRGAAQQMIVGTVADFRQGEWLLIADERFDPAGVQFLLRDRTAFEGAAVKTGVRVSVWYRRVAERHAVADRVLVHPPPVARER